MRSLAQVLAVTAYSLRTIPRRKGSVAAAVCGIAGVVAVMVGVLSIAMGIREAAESSGSPENVIVLRSGANTEMMSGLGGDDVRVISQAAQIARAGGQALASPELFVIVNLPRRSTGTDANVPIRGVTRPAFEVRDDLEIVAGRPFEWGRNEVVVGAGASREFDGLELGGSLKVGSERWPVVGIFETAGGMDESEVWADAKVLQSAYRRGNSYQSVHAKLLGSSAFDAFKDDLTSDPRLSVKVVREGEYHAEQTELIQQIITGLGTIIALLMGLGAVFGALNTMYTAVANRTREIATLRALGFRAGPVVVSVLIESSLLGLAGGVLGGGLAWIAFDGLTTATLNWSSFSQMTFAFDVNAALLGQGIFYALLLGFVGGFFPAIRAARMPVASALREQ